MTKAGSKSKADSSEGPDPRFLPVVAALEGQRGFSLMESNSGATRGLMLEGKSFGMSSHGRLILKLTEERVAELVELGVGTPFYPSPGRAMRGWIEITDLDADWVKFATEAHRIAAMPKAAPQRTAKGGPRGSNAGE
jgi:hypothetical protein